MYIQHKIFTSQFTQDKSTDDNLFIYLYISNRKTYRVCHQWAVYFF